MGITRAHTAVAISLCLATAPAAAQDAARIAEAIPPAVTEIATAGSWRDGARAGVFRAVVVTAPAKSGTQVQLVLQMLEVAADGAASLTRSVPVTTLADKNLPNAFLAVEEDTTENEITWRLTSYDAQSDTDKAVLVSFNAKGQAVVKDAPGALELLGTTPDGATRKPD
jgi:hypothetical protein